MTVDDCWHFAKVGCIWDLVHASIAFLAPTPTGFEFLLHESPSFTALVMCKTAQHCMGSFFISQIIQTKYSKQKYSAFADLATRFEDNTERSISSGGRLNEVQIDPNAFLTEPLYFTVSVWFPAG